MAIRAIFFDLDDTLHGFGNSSKPAMEKVYSAINSRYGIELEKLKEEYAALFRQAEENAFFDGRTSHEYRTERFTHLLKAFGVSDPPFVAELVKLYADTLKNNTRPFPETVSLLENLKGRFSLYLITEGPGDAQRTAVDILGLGEYFEDMFVSGELKKIKATGELFNVSLEKSGLKPSEVVVVGDSYNRDIAGAMKAGIKGIWINRKNVLLGPEDAAPYAQLHSLEHLESVISNMFELEPETKKKVIHYEERPVFVLGHPRSGTNYLSSILMAHEDTSMLIEPFSLHTDFVLSNDLRYWGATDFDAELFHRDLMFSPEIVSFFKNFESWMRFSSEGRLRYSMVSVLAMTIALWHL